MKAPPKIGRDLVQRDERAWLRRMLAGLLGLSSLVVLVACQDEQTEITFINTIDLPIGITSVTPLQEEPFDEGVRERWTYYSGITVGDVDDRTAYMVNEVAPAASYSEFFPGSRFDVLIVGRETSSHVVVFKRLFTSRELRNVDWKVEITDQRP